MVADVSVPVPFPLSASVYEESEPPLLTSLPDVPKVFVEVVLLEPTLAVAASTDKGSLSLTDRRAMTSQEMFESADLDAISLLTVLAA